MLWIFKRYALSYQMSIFWIVNKYAINYQKMSIFWIVKGSWRSMSKKYPCFELSKSVHILNCQEILKLDEQEVYALDIQEVCFGWSKSVHILNCQEIWRSMIKKYMLWIFKKYALDDQKVYALDCQEILMFWIFNKYAWFEM